MANKTLKTLKERIKLDFGKRCKTHSSLCAVCIAYEAYDTLNELFSIKIK